LGQNRKSWLAFLQVRCAPKSGLSHSDDDVCFG
jgi:hypothetical protein